jgi:hypothetical protein
MNSHFSARRRNGAVGCGMESRLPHSKDPREGFWLKEARGTLATGFARVGSRRASRNSCAQNLSRRGRIGHIRDTGRIEQLLSFIQQFPDSQHRTDVERRIKNLPICRRIRRRGYLIGRSSLHQTADTRPHGSISNRQQRNKTVG